MSPDVSVERTAEKKTVCPPEWFLDYIKKLALNPNAVGEISELSTLTLLEVGKGIGGILQDLPYDNLQTLFPQGSDDESVAALLREKRGVYLEDHPEQRVSAGAGDGVIGFDGRFHPIESWNKMTPAERRGAMVGTTCFHYNTDVPGMSDTD